MSKLRRTIRRLSDPRDLWLFLQILIVLILLPRLIRNKSLPDLLRELDPGVAPPEHQIDAPSRDKLEKTVGFVDSLLRYRVFQRYGKCLLRSLILFRFLRSQGWPVEIHFGVRKTGEAQVDYAAENGAFRMGITGHSWLVMEGEPFLENPEQATGFSTTYRYPD